MILCIVVLLAIFSTSVYGNTIEVSPGGSLKSLEDARDHIRTLRKAGETGAMKVVLRAGTYRLERTFVLTPEDSGTPEAPISYEAFPGERVVISGGRDLGTGLKKESSNTWAWHLPDVESGAWNFRQLFVNGVRVQRSRAPNFGYYRSSGESSQDKPFRQK